MKLIVYKEPFVKGKMKKNSCFVRVELLDS